MSFASIPNWQLTSKKVTEDMLLAEHIRIFGLEERLHDDNGKLIAEFKWKLDGNALAKNNSKIVRVTLGGAHFTTLYVDQDIERHVNENWVSHYLAIHLLQQAHNTNRALNGLRTTVEYCYGRLPTDRRPDGIYRRLNPQMAVQLYVFPKWRKDFDDVGRQINGNDFHNLLNRYVPAMALDQTEHMIKTYAAMWDSIYGGTPGRIHYFEKAKKAGSQLFVTVCNGQTGVTFQFNRIDVLDKDTLVVDNTFNSLSKDFMS